MALTKNDNVPENPWDEPTESEKELVEFVVEHCDRWRQYRDTNFLDAWSEYERIFRGQWAGEDKTRSSERSRLVSPAAQQAVETRHAEIIEAIFGQGDFFDIEDDIKDVNGNPMDVEMLKAQLMEDFKKDKIRKSFDQIVLMGEIYGTGIGEIVVKEETEYIPSTQAIPGVQGQAAIGVIEKPRTAVKVTPVNPKNFLFDPNGTSIEDCMGVAIERYSSIHKIVKGMEDGIYRKVDIQPMAPEDRLEATQENTTFQDEKVKVLTYYGLVPREYLENLENDGKEVADLFPEDSTADEYSELVEAIIIIANDELLLKAEANPYMMKDRPVVLYQSDTVPNRLLGRGTVEKAYNMQKAIDAQIRSHLDSLALTSAPMMAMDATRLPRGAKFEVKPGKAILTNGAPSEILMPFKFGNTDPNNLTTAQTFQQMLLQATGTLDSNGMVSQVSRDAGQGGISMATASIIKKYKRTLTNFQEDFLVPFIKKAVFRFMQFDPERYPSVDMNFIPTASLGIMAREYEQQQFIALLQTLGPNTPVLPVILKGIVQNSSLSNRYEMLAELEKMSQPNPQQQQIQQQAMMLDMASKEADVAKKQAEAQKASAEAAVTPDIAKAKVIAALSNNLNEDNESKDFERRLKLADLALREKDIASNERIANAQIAASQHKTAADFVTKLNAQLGKAAPEGQQQ